MLHRPALTQPLMSDYKRITCFAVDDEPPALNVLQKHIANTPALELAGTCNNAVEALEIFQQRQIDLLFIDIQMPQILGTDFIRALKNPPKVIFTTAYRKFAVEGFELNAVDYLLKPVSFERFLKAVNKVMDLSLQSAANVSPVVPSNDASEMHLYFKANRRMIKVLLNEILYVESLKDYVRIVSHAKTIVTKQSISALEEMLPRNQFIRIHRSYIVAISKIESYNHEVIAIARKELPISRMYRHDVTRTFEHKHSS